ncbi:unnamed protein product [Mytilus edulis]|uniref:Integrase catalytic domain-containing protein n=1 Tax=Mytilus edulis TaxID=6550 RepID=A0A8S3V6C5_MYTED|nr:unnamed protein product [Mytilus edulis]
MVESFPMENMEASTVANIIVTEIICRFGVPTLIHSDQGRQFESELFSEMCNLLQISKTRTTPYHPQSDGMVERFNSTLVKMLIAYVDEHHTNWDQLLPYVMMAYRTAVHETTGSTPNRMMMGREVATPVDIMYKLRRGVKSIPANKWMANTKKTPRKRWMCPVCQIRFQTEKELEDHVIGCAKRRSSEEEYLCDWCPYATSRKSDFTRHQRRRHAASLPAIDDTDSEWEKQNPGTLLDVLGEPTKSTKSTTGTSVMVTGSLIKGRKRLLDTLKSSLGPQPIAKRFALPRLPTTTATVVVPPVSSSFLIPRMMDTDSDDSSVSNPSPPLFSSSPMDLRTVTTTTTGTIPSLVPAQVVRPVATSGLMLVKRRVVRRYKENGKDVEETEIWKR